MPHGKLYWKLILSPSTVPANWSGSSNEDGKPLEIQLLAVKRNFGRNLIVAKKSKADVASATVGKRKAMGRSTSAKGRKSATRKKNHIQKTEPVSSSQVAFDPTDEQIQTRAYFISERRRRFDLPGDANSDWLEAKRQLLSEAGPG
jgi:hypothetical protein